jgi:iron complex outermembrane receptor protein
MVGLDKALCQWAVSPLVAALVLGAAPRGVEAQDLGSIDGRVTDARTSRPVRDIVVEATGPRHTYTVTDGEGRYVLSALPAGDYTLRFTWYGYRSHEETVPLPAGGSVERDVAMEPQPLELGEVVVSAPSRRPERVLESLASVSVVPPERVKDVLVTGQAPLLVADMPGVHLMQSGVNSFNVNARGFNEPSTRSMLVLVDGVDQGNPMVGAQEWPFIAVTEEGASVELVRGPSSALYGANAFSGVLSITTPSAREVQGTRVTLSAGELSTLGVDARHAGVSSDLRWGYEIEGAFMRSGSWDRSRTNLGDLQSEYADAVDGPVTPPDPGYELAALRGQTKEGTFGLPGPVTGEPDPLTTARGSARVEYYRSDGGVVTAEGGYSRLENQVNGSALSRAQVMKSTRPWARFAYATDALDLNAYYVGRDGDQVDLASGGRFQDHESRTHLEAQTRRSFLDDRAKLVVGGSFRSEVIDSKGSILAPRYDGRSDEYYALFGELGVELGGGLRLTVAGRYDDASLFDPQVSPKLGVQWAATDDQVFRLTWGRAYETPTPADRFLEFPLGPPLDLSALEAGLRASPLGPLLAGVPDGTLLTTSAAVPLLALGNEHLHPAQVASVEAGYKGQLGRVFLTTDVHVSDYDNFKTGLLPGVNPDYAPWTAPAAVPAAAAGAVEDAVRTAVPGITRLPDGSTAVVLSSSTAGRARQWGLDVAVGINANEHLRLDGNYSYLNVRFKDGSFQGADSVAANTPTHTANFSGAYTSDGGTRVRLGLNVMSGYDFRSGVWVGPVPSSETVNLNLRHPFTNQLSGSISVTNLLDQRRYHLFGGSIVGRRLIAALTWEPS